MVRLISLLSLAIIIAGVVPASSQDLWDTDHLEVLIPQAEGSLEKMRFADQKYVLPSLDLRDNPPVGPVRNCAEWEPTSGVMVRYPLGLPYSLLRDFDDQVTIHVVVSSGYQSTAQNNLASNGVDMDKVEFLVRSNDSIWTRDYGPWFIFNGEDNLGIVNHTYNRPYRPNDNLVPYYFGLQQDLPVYSHSMYHTGGNYMTDGAHISSSTQLVYNEAADDNGMTSAEVDALMNEYYGMENYAVLDYIESGGIHHIDTWAKFLDEETVLVKEVWPSHHTYQALEQRAVLLASLTASTGRPYQVHRVYCYSISGGSPASYTNSIILNNHIYVPFFGNTTYDEAALETYRTAAPGYEVSGYYYSGFLSDDALHCRTKGIMDEGMLRVGHIPLRDDQEGPALVQTEIKAHSGSLISEAIINYRHNEGQWYTAALLEDQQGQYSAEIPAPAEASICEYYISVSDESGRSAGMPRTQPEATYLFNHQASLSSAPTGGLPMAAQLNGNFPNPFNPSTTFNFTLAFEDEAELSILDARGHLVRVLASGVHGAGDHSVQWDGKDANGRNLPSGVYLYQLRAAGLQYTKTATLIK